MDGIGAVSTSSPTSPVTGRPEESNASTLAPRQDAAITPARTGSSGQGPTNPVHRSVPPEYEPRIRSWPSVATASYTQRKPSGGSGDPVEPIPRSLDRSSSTAGRSPALIPATMYRTTVPA